MKQGKKEQPFKHGTVIVLGWGRRKENVPISLKKTRDEGGDRKRQDNGGGDSASERGKENEVKQEPETRK